MKLPNLPYPSQDATVSHRYLGQQWATLTRVVNALILGGPGSNIQSTTTTLTTGAANTDFAVSHTLGRIPTGFIIIGQNAASNFYNGVTAWTSTQIFLRSSTATVNVTVLVI